MSEFMAAQNPLSEQEMRFLKAFKLFLMLDPERSKIAQTFAGLSPEALDKLSPNEQRTLIRTYHMALEDPNAFLLAHKVVSTIVRPFSRVLFFCLHRRSLCFSVHDQSIHVVPPAVTEDISRGHDNVRA